MDNQQTYQMQQAQAGVLATNKVLRNTYVLLALTLAFSAIVAGVAAAVRAPALPWFVTLIGYFALLFATTKLRNSAGGLVAVFALTGFMGYTLGPLLSMYASIPGGNEIVMLAFGGTAAIFFVMSGIALVTRKDFSFMGKFLLVGILVAFVAGIGAIFFQLPGLSLAVAAMFMVLSSLMILYQTSEIIHGGETNYIMATVTLYVSLYNIFVSLLQLLGVMGDD